MERRLLKLSNIHPPEGAVPGAWKGWIAYSNDWILVETNAEIEYLFAV